MTASSSDAWRGGASAAVLEVRQAALAREHGVEREHGFLLVRLVCRAKRSAHRARQPDASVMSLPDTHSSGVASTVMTAASESGRSVVAKRIIAEHDHDAHGGGRGGAEARVHQMHVVEHLADARQRATRSVRPSRG